MHFKFKHLHKIVGGFFLLACLLLMFLLMLVARGQRWFQDSVPYVTYMEGASGVSAGASVMLKGIEAGKIESVTLTDENRVRVDFGVYQQFADRMRKGVEISLSSPLIGSSSLELKLGPGDANLLAPRSTVPIHDAGGGGLDELVGTVTKLVKRLEDPDGDMMQILVNVEGMTGKLDQALANEKGSLYSQLNSAMEHLDSILENVDESSPDIRDAITEARKAVEETNKVILALQKSFLLRGNIEQYLKEDSTLRMEGR